MRGRTSALTLAALVAFPVAGYAQEVRGTATTGTEHEPSSETSIVLIDRAGRIIGSALTSASGTYELRAPAPGSYRVRARRVGFLPDSSALLDLNGRSPTTYDPVMRSFPIAIDPITVVEARRCVLAGSAGAAAFRLWQEVQNALSATLATSESKKTGFTLQRFTREVDPGSGTVINGRSWQVRTVALEPFVSVAPESLATRGYRRAEKDSALYFAPDARTLTSEAFAAGHCLKPVPDGRPGMVGLGFEPSRARDGDVRGVLWLDRSTLALRSLDYSYVDSHNTDTALLATGHIKYNRLPSGGWFISSWLIRVPVTTTVISEAPQFVGNPQFGTAFHHTSTNVIEHMWEVGGNVAGIFDATHDAGLPASELGRVQGTVLTSGTRAPLVGIDLLLRRQGNPSAFLRARTGSDGTFVFDSVPGGAYIISADAPRLDTLNTPVPPIAVIASPGVASTISVEVASPQAGMQALCRDGIRPDHSALHGSVRDSVTGTPVGGARVRVSWLTGTSRSNGSLSSFQHDRVTFTDASGRYAFCNLEPTPRLIVEASSGSARTSRMPSVNLNAGELRLYDVSLAMGLRASSPAGVSPTPQPE